MGSNTPTRPCASQSTGMDDIHNGRHFRRHRGLVKSLSDVGAKQLAEAFANAKRMTFLALSAVFVREAVHNKYIIETSVMCIIETYMAVTLVIVT